MRAIILLLLLATVVLFACKKEEKEPEKKDQPTRYCTYPCYSNLSIEWRDFSSPDIDTIRFRVFDGASNFTRLLKDSIIHNQKDYLIQEDIDENNDYEVIFSSGDTFRIADIIYTSDSQTIACYRAVSPCMRSLTSISLTVNGQPKPAQYQATEFIRYSLYLHKP